MSVCSLNEGLFINRADLVAALSTLPQWHENVICFSIDSTRRFLYLTSSLEVRCYLMMTSANVHTSGMG